MKNFFRAGVMSLSLIAAQALAADPEFNKECALGLAAGMHVPTDCSVSWTAEDGKVYCFSSEESKAEFHKNTEGNLQKAGVFWTSERIGQ